MMIVKQIVIDLHLARPLILQSRFGRSSDICLSFYALLLGVVLELISF